MKKPKNRNSPIDLKRIGGWVREFSGYRHQVPEDRIREWLTQFNGHLDIAARLLDCVEFINNEQIRTAFRTMLNALPGWHHTKSQRTGEWRFVPYSASAGESGDSMLHVFRHANNLASSRFNELFIYRSDLLRKRLGANDTVVLIDDMVGSGEQVCSSWDEAFAELLTEIGNVYLIVVVACDHALQRIADETDIQLVPHMQLHDEDNTFDNDCTHFNADEKSTILKYCKSVNGAHPKGFGDCGLVLVLAHAIPNNSLPILGETTDNWEPLFRRYD